MNNFWWKVVLGSWDSCPEEVTAPRPVLITKRRGGDHTQQSLDLDQQRLPERILKLVAFLAAYTAPAQQLPQGPKECSHTDEPSDWRQSIRRLMLQCDYQGVIGRGRCNEMDPRTLSLDIGPAMACRQRVGFWIDVTEAARLSLFDQ